MRATILQVLHDARVSDKEILAVVNQAIQNLTDLRAMEYHATVLTSLELKEYTGKEPTGG